MRQTLLAINPYFWYKVNNSLWVIYNFPHFYEHLILHEYLTLTVISYFICTGGDVNLDRFRKKKRFCYKSGFFKHHAANMFFFSPPYFGDTLLVIQKVKLDRLHICYQLPDFLNNPGKIYPVKLENGILYYIFCRCFMTHHFLNISIPESLIFNQNEEISLPNKYPQQIHYV